jgi:hypothetical protein
VTGKDDGSARERIMMRLLSRIKQGEENGQAFVGRCSKTCMNDLARFIIPWACLDGGVNGANLP